MLKYFVLMAGRAIKWIKLSSAHLPALKAPITPVKCHSLWVGGRSAVKSSCLVINRFNYSGIAVGSVRCKCTSDEDLLVSVSTDDTGLWMYSYRSLGYVAVSYVAIKHIHHPSFGSSILMIIYREWLLIIIKLNAKSCKLL